MGKVCTQCVSFFMLPLYTAVLSTSDYGTADLIITYISLFSPLISFQFDQGLFRYLLDCRDDARQQGKLLSTVLLANILQTFIFTVGFGLVYAFVRNGLLIYLYVLIILQIFQGTLMQFARGIDKTLVYTITSFLSALIHISGNVLLVGIVKIGLPGLFISMVAAGVFCLFYLVIKLRVWDYVNFKDCEKKDLFSLAKYSLPLIPNQLAWWVINASDRTIVSCFLGTGANGIYSVANKFSSAYISFYNYFNMSWTESVSISINDNDRDAYIKKMSNAFFNVIAAMCLGIIACMPFLFPLLVNINYDAAYNHIPILMIAVFFQALQGLYSAVYVALKKTKEIAKTSAFSAVINIAVNVALIRYIGLYAASISTLFAFLTMCVYRYFDIKRYIDFKLYKRNFFFAIGICIIVCAAYYMRNDAVQVVALIIVVVYSVAMNIDMIKNITTFIKRKLGGI